MSETNDDSVHQDLNENIDLLVNKINTFLENEIMYISETEIYAEEKFLVLNQQKTGFETNKLKARATIDEAKALCDCLEKSYVSKKNESSNLKIEFKDLDNKYKILVNEYENLEEKCLELKSKLSISSQDKSTLELDKKKLDLYEMATNVVWDYSVPINSTISGCVRNKKTNYLQTFVFKNDEISAKEVQDKLWDEIEKGVLKTCKENNENVPINK